MTLPSPPTAQASGIPQDDTWHPPAPTPSRRGLAVALVALLATMVVLAVVTAVTLFEQSRVASRPNSGDAAFYSYRLVTQVDRLVSAGARVLQGSDSRDFVQRLQGLSTFVNPGTAESAAGVALLRTMPEASQDLGNLDDRLRKWREEAESGDPERLRQTALNVTSQAEDLRTLADHVAGVVHSGQKDIIKQSAAALSAGFHKLQWTLAGLIGGSVILAIWLLVLHRHARHFNQRMAQANARLESAVAHRTRQLVWLANTDPLTGLKNRRAFMETAEAQILQCRRYPHPLAALLIDIDHFKSINDRYGHHVGDQAIRRVTDTITNTLRDSDIVGRFGGEEFAALMPHTDLAAALVAAERLRQAVAGMKIGLLEGGPLSMTISIGLAMHEAGVSLDTLLMRADMALYRAKSCSRNRVEVYGREREEVAQ
jgi:diguanylate cyclase (GGDEF)-like protein